MKTKEWLKKTREENNLTQVQLANKIGISFYTIQNIEQGKRLGSPEIWEKIENYFDDGTEGHYSYDSDELIKELKQDIFEFGEDKKCILVYKVVNNHIIFTNYDFITREYPFNPKEELEKDEKYIITTFKYALEVFEAQNKIL